MFILADHHHHLFSPSRIIGIVSGGKNKQGTTYKTVKKRKLKLARPRAPGYLPLLSETQEEKKTAKRKDRRRRLQHAASCEQGRCELARYPAVYIRDGPPLAFPCLLMIRCHRVRIVKGVPAGSEQRARWLHAECSRETHGMPRCPGRLRSAPRWSVGSARDHRHVVRGARWAFFPETRPSYRCHASRATLRGLRANRCGLHCRRGV